MSRPGRSGTLPAVGIAKRGVGKGLRSTSQKLRSVTVVVTLALLTACCTLEPVTPQAPLSPELERALAYPQLTPLLATEFSHTDIRRSGAAGGNTRLSANVAPQGEAAYYAVLLGLAESNSDHLYAAIDALEFGLSLQTSDGGFRGQGSAEVFRFLVFGQAALSILQHSRYRHGFSTQIDSVMDDLLVSVRTISELLDGESGTDNSNIQAAAAFLFYAYGDSYDDSALRQAAEDSLGFVIEHQDPSGYYLEHGGWDSSYQMVNVFTLFFLYLISGNEADRQATILQSLEAGWQWMSPRIDRTTGRIDDAGNTRTANDPADSSEGKGSNYFDASLGLVYLFALEFAGAEGAADAAVAYLMSS